MARIFFRFFTENNPVMGYSKTFCIPEVKGLRSSTYTIEKIIQSNVIGAAVF